MDLRDVRVQWRLVNHVSSDSEDSSDKDTINDEIKFDTSESELDGCSVLNGQRTCALSLINAIERHENIDVMQEYFNEYYLNAVNKMRNTCLHVAVSVVPYDLNVIDVLLLQGANINAQNLHGYTPLHLAAENPQCNADLIQMLLDGGANPNIRNSFNDTPLHIFLMKCNIYSSIDRVSEIIKLLLVYGAKPNAKNEFRSTPIQIAVLAPHCHGRVIAELINHGADITVASKYNESLLHKAVQFCVTFKLDIVKILLQHKPDFVQWKDANGRTPLHSAIFFKVNLDIVKELINKGSDVNAKDCELNTPLHLARRSCYSVIEILVRYGADVNAKNLYGNTPLLESINPRLFPVDNTAVTAFIELGACLETLDKMDNSALHYALCNNSVKPGVIRLLFENSAKPFNVNFPYDPPIYYCSDNRDIALLYIQFFILHDIVYRCRVSKPERMISFDLYGPALSNIFSKFRDSCISEIFQMKKDKLSKDLLFYSYVLGNIHCKYESYPSSFIKEVLIRMNSNKYPHCMDLLRACIKRNQLIEYMSCLIVYSNVSNTSKSIILDYDSTLTLVKFLDKNTLLSLVEAFSDDICSANKYTSSKLKKSCNIPGSTLDYSTVGKSKIKRKRTK